MCNETSVKEMQCGVFLSAHVAVHWLQIGTVEWSLLVRETKVAQKVPRRVKEGVTGVGLAMGLTTPATGAFRF